MTGGRWSGQTRFAIVLVGLILVALGILTTVQFRSETGAAVLIGGGLLVGLAGMSGGAIVVRSADQEARVASAARAQLAGDAEGAYDRFVQILRGYTPQAVEYQEAANAAVYEAAGREGRRLQPIFGYFLGPLAMSGSVMVVDVRAGTGFSIARMQTTYQALLAGPTAPFQGALVVINATPDDPMLGAVNQLTTALDRPVVAVSWRSGEPTDRIAAAIVRLGDELRRRGLDAGRPDEPATPAAVADQPFEDTFAESFDEPFDEPDAGPERYAPPERIAEPQPQVEPERVRIPTQTPSIVDDLESLDDVEVEPSRAAEWPAPEPRRRPPPAPRVYDDSASWQRATDLHWRGQLQEAEQAYREIVEARARALGWDHPDTLTARDQHATVLRDLDRLAEALVECDEALSTRTRILGDDHPDTLTSRSHLATIYHQLGDLARAETEHQRVLEARTRVLGANHQETLISRSNLAKVYQDMGELDRAIDEHHTVMRARSQLLGPEHRDTLMSRSLLASALHHAGRLVEAEAEHRSVLGSRLRLLGPVHLDTAVSRHRLASVLHDLGRLDEAINEYRAAQSVYAQLLGPSSPFARAAASDLAMAERALREAQGSRRAY